MIPSITPVELNQELQSDHPPLVVDVREAHELETSSIPYSVKHIPLGDLPRRLGELDPTSDIVVMCRVGGRSSHAVQFLLQNGFTKVRNLTSGINGWSQTVDPSVRSY